MYASAIRPFLLFITIYYTSNTAFGLSVCQFMDTGSSWRTQQTASYAAENIHAQFFVGTYVFIFPEHIPRSGTAGSCGHSVLNFLGNRQPVFQSDCSVLYSHNQCVRVPPGSFLKILILGPYSPEVWSEAQEFGFYKLPR